LVIVTVNFLAGVYKLLGLIKAKQHAAMSLVWFFDVVGMVFWRGGFEC
jgi:hypothetical protein